MSFNLSLSDDIVVQFDEPVLKGKIEINDYVEYFFSPVELWKKIDYLKSWKKSLSECLRGGRCAVLLTSMGEPEFTNFLFCWVVFLEGDLAYIQNKVIFLENLPKPFNLEKLNSYVSDREEINEDGDVISQWCVGADSIVEFFNTL